MTVLDSNIGAEYGRFKGGVVKANTCAPTRKLAGQVSVESTRSSWMQYKLSDSQKDSAANSATAALQPEFEKWTYRAALQGKITENFSLIGSFIRKTSEIPLNGYANGLIAKATPTARCKSVAATMPSCAVSGPSAPACWPIFPSCMRHPTASISLPTPKTAISA